MLLTSVSIAGILSVAISFWRERPLREAEAALDSHRAARALQITTDYLEARPGHQRAEAIRARALVAAGQPERAVEIFERIGAASTDDLHAWARALLQSGRWAAARPLLEEIVRQVPHEADVHHEMASCYANLGYYREALASATRFMELSGQEARGQLMIGTLHRDAGNKEQAAKAYSKVLEGQPSADNLQVAPQDFFHAYGTVLLDLGETERAVELIVRSLAIRPTAAAYSDLGRAYEQLGRAEEAEEAWDDALSIDSGNKAAREGLAGIALRRSDADRALTLLAPFAEVATPPASAAYLLQRAYTLAGDSAAAERWRTKAEALRAEERLRSTIDRVLTEAPHSAWTNVLRAYQSAEREQWSEAEALLQVVALNDPFVAKLRTAVRNRSELPPLKDLPISRF